MISRKSLWITTVSITGAALLAVLLYIAFHILFIFLFIPLAFVGPLFGNRRKGKNDNWRDDLQRDSYKNDKNRYLPPKDE